MTRTRTLAVVALTALTVLLTACLPAPPAWTSDSPSGALDVVTRTGNTIVAEGWAGDRDTTAPIAVAFSVDGKLVKGTTTANGTRTDVNRATGRAGNFGYTRTLTVPAGTRTVTVCAFGINVGPGEHTLLGCKAASGRPGAPTTSTTTTTAPVELSISTITPASGPQAGGTTVTIVGTGFTGADQVLFGTEPAVFTLDSPTQITATAPAGTPGIVDVSIDTTTDSVTANDAYTYIAAPTITELNPTSRPFASPVMGTITGTGFTGATSVTFGATGVGFTVISDTQISAFFPPLPVGTYPVVVTTPDGSNATTSASTFTITP